MGGEIPPFTPRERMEATRARHEASEAAATEAEARTRAAHDAAPPGRSTTRVSDTAARLSEAAGVLDVPVDADSQEIRRAYLREAIRTHPDKGGSAEAFDGLREAYQLLNGVPGATRQDAARAMRDAKAAVARAQRDAARPAEQGAHRLLREVTQARAEARRRAETEWIPPWRTAAQHLRTASSAFMELWTEYQRMVTRHLNAYARSDAGGGYATHGERQAAAAAIQKATRRHARDVARRKAVADMRDAERRAAHARRAAAEAAAQRMRQQGQPMLMEAARLDGHVLMQDYRVQVPFAAWKGHQDSTLDLYELYEITETDTDVLHGYVTLVRSAASAAERKLPLALAGWNRFQVSWACLTGVTRFGPERKGFLIVPRGAEEATSGTEAATSDEERQLEAHEESRAVRSAKRLIDATRAANRDASRVLRDAARQEGGHTAADDALQHEEADGAQRAETDGSDSDRQENGHGTATRTDILGAVSARHRGTWSGRNWAREAWTGPVAAAEYAEAWNRDPPPRSPGSAAADAARRAAQQASIDANTMGHNSAVETAVQETQRRSRRLWGAAGDAAEMYAQQRATDFLAEFVRQWREKEPPIPQPHEAMNATQAAAAAAADAIQRRQPAKDTVAAAARKRVIIDAARLLVSSGVQRNPAHDAALAHLQQQHQQDAGRREAVSMMAAVIECLPNSTGATRRLPAPDAPGVRARHNNDDDASATSPEDDAIPRATADPPLPDDAALCPPTTSPHEEYRHTRVTIHVGNMHTEGRTGRRPEGAEDRRVDRGTPLGNPFPIDMTDDSAREAACEAYTTLVQGDPESLNVQEIAVTLGLRVDRRYTSRGAVRAMHRALRQLEHDVTALRPGKSIRLMCHCAPKRCHAHVIAHEIQRRLRTRDVHILVEDGGWGRTEVLYGDDDRGDDDMSTNCEDGGNADSIRDAGAGTEERANATHDPAMPCGAHTDAASGQPEPFPKLLARIKGHRENRLRNESAIAAFFGALPGPGALTRAHPHSLPAATRSRETNGPGDADGSDRDNGGGADAARAAGAVGTQSARRRKSPTAMARVKAAIAKAAAERAARAARATADAATGIAKAVTATGATATAATVVAAKRATETEAGTTAAEATATREATTAQALAEAETTAAADGWVRMRDTLGPNDSHGDGTTRATRQKTTPGDEDDEEQAHDTDGDAVKDGCGAGGTRATLRATGDGGTTDGNKQRGERGGRSETAHRARKRQRNDKYGNEAK